MTEDKSITRKAWEALKTIPYNEDGIKIFEEICTELDNGTYNGFTFKEIGLFNGKLMVLFQNDGYEPTVYEFQDGMEIYMSDTLCYEEDAQKFLELLEEYDLKEDDDEININKTINEMNRLIDEISEINENIEKLSEKESDLNCQYDECIRKLEYEVQEKMTTEDCEVIMDYFARSKCVILKIKNNKELFTKDFEEIANTFNKSINDIKLEGTATGILIYIYL